MQKRILIQSWLTGGLLFSVSNPVLLHAATWEQSFSVPLGLVYEDNPRLAENDPQSVRRTTLSPEYSVKVTQDLNEWSGKFQLGLERSSDTAVSADREDPSIQLGWTHLYETGELGLSASFRERSSRSSEFAFADSEPESEPFPGADVDSDTGTGQLAEDNTQQTKVLSLSWRNALSERYSLLLNASASKVMYEEASATLTGNRNQSMSAQLSYSYNERIEPFARLSFSRFEPDSDAGRTDTRSLDLGVDWRISDRFKVNGGVGVNGTRGETTDSGWQASLDVAYEVQRSNYKLTLSRSRSPSSAGVVNETNQLRAGWTYDLSELENIGINLSWQESLSVNPSKSSQLNASYSRQLSPDWGLQLSARYRERDDDMTRASSSSVSANISYRFSEF